MNKNILITGAAKRIGAVCARFLHQNGCNILIHYRASESEARLLCKELNADRKNSANLIKADLTCLAELSEIAYIAKECWGGIDVLINNASSFYPTPISSATVEQWDELVGSNLRAPFFLIKALSDTLSERNGCVINLVDIHAERGLENHAIYCIAKAGLGALTKILAKELAPNIRVNAIAPGAILWPEQECSEQTKNEILSRIPLHRTGNPTDIAKAALYLIKDADYMTGQTLTLDGGRTLYN